MLVSDAQGKRSQNGGRYLAITFDVIEGQYQRRKLFQNFNIENANQDVVARAWSDWKYFLEALGIDKAFDTEQAALSAVKDRALRVKVGHRKDKQSGDLREQVQDYMADGEHDSTPDPKSEFDAESIPF